ncbi:MAG TPA: uroporphyrinogen decarboxylase family protein, partial [Thermoanaerobaculia bacterium]|nr:uroporphyrinogen decarboxylase family protein [Thermoanaerobaculia bacterium]
GAAGRAAANRHGGGHVANLGHGIFKETPPEHAEAFVAAVQRLSRRG